MHVDHLPILRSHINNGPRPVRLRCMYSPCIYYIYLEDSIPQFCSKLIHGVYMICDLFGA